MMERLRAMREPLKYVQGRDALLKFKDEMGYMGHRWLFVCSKAAAKLVTTNWKKASQVLTITDAMKSLAESPAMVKLAA